MELVVDNKHVLGEGIVWDDRGARLFWTDIERSELWSLAPGTGALQRWPLPERLCCIALTGDDDRLLLGLASGLAFFDLARGALERICPIEDDVVHVTDRHAFPVRPMIGCIGVAPASGTNSTIMPAYPEGGNMDVTEARPGSTVYLPVRVPGAMFFVGDPHMAQGDGEVSLTAMEGSLRATVRLSIVRPGEGGAPQQTREFPFAETPDHWIPMGLSDPDGPEGDGQGTDLDVAMVGRQVATQALDPNN